MIFLISALCLQYAENHFVSSNFYEYNAMSEKKQSWSYINIGT